MRIIGGIHSGRRLIAVPGSDTRPTADRVREALFNIWQTQVADAQLWDAYAGTGAIGLEAISRGAAWVDFSESARDAIKTLRRNVDLLNVTDRARIWSKTAEEYLAQAHRERRQFDLIFLDPPWRLGVSSVVRDGLAGVLAPDGIAVVESRQDNPVAPLSGLHQLWTRRYGDTRLTAFGLTSP